MKKLIVLLVLILANAGHSMVDVLDIYIPDPLSFTNLSRYATMDADGEMVAMKFMVPKSGNIAKIGFLTATVAQCDANGLDVGLYTIDADGTPNNGSAYGSMVLGTQGSPASNTHYLVTLGTPATATKGNIIAAIIEWNTWNAGNDVDIRLGAISGNTNFPSAMLYTGSWAHAIYRPVIGLEYDDGSYAYTGCEYYVGNSGLAYDEDDDPDEYATCFHLNVGARVKGIWFFGFSQDAGSDYEAILYEGTTAKATKAVDGDVDSSTTGLTVIFFDTAYTITADTTYYAAVRPTAGVDKDMYIYQATFSAAAGLNSLPGGSDFYEANRVGQGAWTPVTTNRMAIGIIIDQINEGAGGNPRHGTKNGGKQ